MISKHNVHVDLIIGFKGQRKFQHSWTSGQQVLAMSLTSLTIVLKCSLPLETYFLASMLYRSAGLLSILRAPDLQSNRIRMKSWIPNASRN